MTTELNKELLLRAYRMMRRIRDFEERVHVEFATGEIPGFVHLYAGEEAPANRGYFAPSERRLCGKYPSGTWPLYRQGNGSPKHDG